MKSTMPHLCMPGLYKLAGPIREQCKASYKRAKQSKPMTLVRSISCSKALLQTATRPNPLEVVQWRGSYGT